MSGSPALAPSPQGVSTGDARQGLRVGGGRRCGAQRSFQRPATPRQPSLWQAVLGSGPGLSPHPRSDTPVSHCVSLGDSCLLSELPLPPLFKNKSVESQVGQILKSLPAPSLFIKQPNLCKDACKGYSPAQSSLCKLCQQTHGFWGYTKGTEYPCHQDKLRNRSEGPFSLEVHMDLCTHRSELSGACLI